MDSSTRLGAAPMPGPAPAPGGGPHASSGAYLGARRCPCKKGTLVQMQLFLSLARRRPPSAHPLPRPANKLLLNQRRGLRFTEGRETRGAVPPIKALG